MLLLSAFGAQGLSIGLEMITSKLLDYPLVHSVETVAEETLEGIGAALGLAAFLWLLVPVFRPIFSRPDGRQPAGEGEGLTFSARAANR